MPDLWVWNHNGLKELHRVRVYAVREFMASKKARGSKPQARIVREPIKGESPPRNPTTVRGTPRKNNAGRKEVQIDGAQVRTMASYGCTVAEIAAVLKCSEDTLGRRFATELKEGRNARNGMLRVKQFKLADKSAAMAIFLGKNYLGQKDIVKYDRLSDPELIDLAREAGIDIGAVGEAAPSAEQAEEPGAKPN